LNKKVSSGFTYDYIFTRFIECKNKANIEINGVYIYKNCYDYKEPYGQKYFDLDTLRKCNFFKGLDTDFSLNICKECDRLSYCKKIVVNS